MDIRVFKTFIQVAKTKHFGQAAENLYITQAAVSARIKQLESFYGTVLFIRYKNNLTLSPSGETLLKHAYLMIEQMEASKQALNQINQQKNRFKIVATPNIWDAFLSSRIEETIKYFPNTLVSSEISVREAIQRQLNERSIDIGLLTDPIKDDEYHNQLIGYFELALVSTSKDSKSLIDAYVFVDWGINFQKEHKKNYNIEPVFKTSTAMVALEVLLSQGGCAYLPVELVKPYIQENKLVELASSISIKRPIYMVNRVNAQSEKSIKAYGDFLQKTLND